jgi:cysteine desulfurase/selenocysteine lyase
MSLAALLDAPARFDPLALRAEFSVLDRNPGLVFLDTAASSQKPNVVIDGLAAFYRADYANVHRGVYGLSARSTDRYAKGRQSVRRFLNAAHDSEIVFVRGATEAINLVAYSWGATFLQTGDRVIISQGEHHSNIVPWQFLRHTIGIELVVAPIDCAGGLDLAAFAELLNERTKLVAITHVANVMGPYLASAQHRADGTRDRQQCIAGRLPDPAAPAGNVQDLDCDFYVFSGHKLYGPTGIGGLYAKRSILESMPPWQGGGDIIETVTFEKTTYAPPLQRFEAGTPDISGAVGLGLAIGFIESLGRDAIRDHEAALTESAAERLAAMPGVSVVGAGGQRIGVVSFVVDGVHPHDLATILDQHNIAVRAGHHGAQATDGPSGSGCNHASIVRRLQRRVRYRRSGRSDTYGAENLWLFVEKEPIMDTRDLYKGIILDHARHPRNFNSLAEPSHLAHGHNPLCGDKITVFMNIAQDRITKVSFEGRGCAISTASASLMTDIMVGKTLDQATMMFNSFYTCVTTGETIDVAAELEDDNDRLEPLTGVRTYPARVKCATLAWHTFDAALKSGVQGDTVKTE